MPKFDFDVDKETQNPYIEVKPVNTEQERLERDFEKFKKDTVIDRLEKLSNDSSIVSKMFNLFCQDKLLSDDERDIGKFQE
jgi:hypothetical protein